MMVVVTSALSAGEAMSTPVQVPQRMLLSPSMASADLSDTRLIPLQIDGEHKTVDETEVMKASEVLAKHSGRHGSLCFVVRRPG